MAVGVTNKRALEIAGGLGFENNVVNLVTNFGFEAIFFDGDQGNVECAHRFFHKHKATKDTFGKPGGYPIFRGDYVTRDNFNTIIKEQTGWEGDIDVFSLDLDSIDYWLWDALTVVSPRVVVVEIQEVWGARERWTRPYKIDGSSISHPVASMGASLGAFTYLAEKRGYRLVGCFEKGYNAFFVREDAVEGGLDSLFGSGKYDAAGCFAHVDTNWRSVLTQRRMESISKYDWVDPETGEMLDPRTHSNVWQV
jgi:hypothetical protein